MAAHVEDVGTKCHDRANDEVRGSLQGGQDQAVVTQMPKSLSTIKRLFYYPGGPL